MKPVLWIPASCALAFALSSCGNNSSSGNPQATTGPFDSRGNYVEEWADNPSKWRKSGGTPSPHELKTDELPEIAVNDQPPQNSVPLPTPNVSKPAPVIAQTQVTKPKSTTTKPSATVVESTTRPVEKPATVSKPKPKPKVVAKAKPKPKSTRYVVKKGDSLSAIASRTGTSVSAIKAQNGISGTLIRPGQSLVIPKR